MLTYKIYKILSYFSVESFFFLSLIPLVGDTGATEFLQN